MRLTGGKLAEAHVESIQVGDKVQVVDDTGRIKNETVIYNDVFSPGQMRDLTRITLASGKEVTTTAHHMMCVWSTQGVQLKRADAVNIGDCFKTATGLELA